MIAQNSAIFVEGTQPLQEPPKADRNPLTMSPITISRHHLIIGIWKGASCQLLQMMLEVTQNAE